MKRSLRYGALALLAAVALQAMAADGYVTGDVTLRAGPDSDYPAVDMIPAGAAIDIMGCTDGWEWCDVVFDDERGWIAGNFIQDRYDDRPVLVATYGARLGIPIVSFSIVTYWDRYYVGRPFYRERERWYRRAPPHHAPPPPSPRPWAPPRHREDNRAEHDHRHAATAPYRPAEPAPGHAPPRVPIDRPLLKTQPAPRNPEQHRQPPPVTMPALPPRRVPAGHPPADHRTDARHGPPASDVKDDKGH